jgi:hypothetical protein
VFFVRLSPYPGLAQDIFDFREQLCFFVVVVAFHEAVPCPCVADEGRLVGGADMWGLQVDGVVATEDGVVDVGHVSCAGCEDVGLMGRLVGARKVRGRAVPS